MKTLNTTFLYAFLVLASFSCSQEDPQNIDPLQMDLITSKESASSIDIIEPALFPEGIDYDKQNNRFLVSSITRGDIGQVIDGEYSPWVSNENFVSTLGLHVDQSRKRVLITNSNINGGLAALAAYDLSGNFLFYTDLHTLTEGGHFVNDVTVDNKGNAYVTDSYAGLLYKVTPDGQAEIFLAAQALAPTPPAFGMNGIDYDPRGFLLISRADTHSLIKVPLDDPEAYSEVQLDTQLFSPDGIYFKSPNELLVVSGNFGGENARLHTFKTTDKWKTATLVDEFLTPDKGITTVTMRRNVPYVLVAHLEILISGGTTDTFTILKAE